MRRSPITLYETLVRPNICYLKNKLFWFPNLSFNLPTFVLIGCSWQRETHVSDFKFFVFVPVKKSKDQKVKSGKKKH